MNLPSFEHFHMSIEDDTLIVENTQDDGRNFSFFIDIKSIQAISLVRKYGEETLKIKIITKNIPIEIEYYESSSNKRNTFCVEFRETYKELIKSIINKNVYIDDF